MDPVLKALKKLTSKEQKRIGIILHKLSSGDLRRLDIKKLKGRDDIFRVRKGDLRIIYRKTDGSIFILAIERRGESTYRP